MPACLPDNYSPCRAFSTTIVLVVVFPFEQFHSNDDVQESHCAALSMLKEAIQAPQQETMAFITTMHSRIKEIAAVAPPPPYPNAAELDELFN